MWTNYCCKISWFFCNNSLSPPGWPSQDQRLSSTLSRKSWTLLFSKSIKSREKLNAIDLFVWFFLTNFQGIIWELRVGQPHGAPHPDDPNHAPAEGQGRQYQKGGSIFQRSDVLPLACHYWEKSTLGISFTSTSALQVQKSFFPHILSLPSKTQVSSTQSRHAAQPLCTACSAALLQSQHVLGNKPNR